MDSIDRLLAELKANHNQPFSSDASSECSSSSIPPSVECSTAPPLSLEQLLNQLDEGSKQAVRSELSTQAQTKHLQPTEPGITATPSSTIMSADLAMQSGSPEDSLLSQLKFQYDSQDKAQALRQAQEQHQAEQQRQHQEQEKQRRLAALRTQRRAQLAEQARTWLKQLNPKSDEGLWFDEFACGYDSRMEAAIDYLEALQTVERESRRF